VGVQFKAGTACGGSPAACCVADFDKMNGVDLLDVFAFLNAWFAGSPYAEVGGDGTGMPTLLDVFAFLTAWFGGGC
jgi:hypothetical protein